MSFFKKLIGFLCCILLFCLTIYGQTVQAQTKYTIAYFTPRGDDFWAYSAKIAKAASQDLGVNLLWYPAYNDPKLYLKNARAILKDRQPRVDALIFKNYNNLGREIIRWAEAAKIPVFAIEEGLSQEDRKTYGQPREKFSYWLGEFLTDDFDVGYRLAHYLVDQAKARGMVAPGEKVKMVAITGNSFEGSSIQRVKGLHLALSERDDVVLLELLTGHWKLDKGHKRMAQLLNDYPDLDVAWIVNDSMAVGAVKALNAEGIQQGKQILLSSVGSIGQGITPLIEGDTSVSVGGQFMLGTWAMVMLYDYLQGYDFAQESTIMRLSLFTFTPENVRTYYQKVAQFEDWERIDFRQFSKALNANLLKYDFSLEKIMQQLEAESD